MALVFVCILLTGMLWGAVCWQYYIEFRINKGRVPKGLLAQKEKLLALLNDAKGGDAYPKAPGSGPG